MENFTKAFLISLLMSGSFMTNAMDDSKSSDEAMARCLGMSVAEYRSQVAIQQERFAQPLQRSNKSELELEQGLAASLGMKVQEYRLHIARLQEESERLAYQLQAEEERSLRLAPQIEAEQRLRHQEEEKASADLIRLLKREEEDRASAELVQLLQQSHIQEPHSVKQQIRNKTWQYCQGVERPILEKYIVIFQYLSKIAQGSDVHVLDDYVFGSQKMINTILEVGRLYNIDNPKLTLSQVGQEMTEFVNNNKGIFDSYKYEGTALSSQQIIGFLTSHFSNMDNDISPYGSAAQEVWSRAWTLALNLYKQDNDLSAIQVIFDQAVEGHLTRGGCIQGRINRGFVGYVSLLAKSGVNIY